jgi:hypothetical protein
VTTASDTPPPSLLPTAIENVKNERNRPSSELLRGRSMALCRARLRLRSPLRLPLRRAPLRFARLVMRMEGCLRHELFPCIFSPLAHRGGRVIGTDTIGILLVLHVSSDDQEREQGGEDNPNVNAHSSTLAACPLRAESGQRGGHCVKSALCQEPTWRRAVFHDFMPGGISSTSTLVMSSSVSCAFDNASA